MSNREPASKETVHQYLRQKNNWGRWGADDQVGAVNLIDDAKRRRAGGLVRSGRIVSLCRDIPKAAGPRNPRPALHYMRISNMPDGGGGCEDFYGLDYHGFEATHVDAICHLWDDHGMWGGRDAAREVTSLGTRWGGIEHWRNGIVTRGVLCDIPRFRGQPYVTVDKPIHGSEIEDALDAQGVALEPGDALVVYAGRDAFERDHPHWQPGWPEGDPRPGLHASCLPTLRDHDVAVLAWDQMDIDSNEYDVARRVHSACFIFGIALVDNCDLGPLAEACQLEGRYDFMFSIAPLPVPGGTGSPVNPVVLF